MIEKEGKEIRMNKNVLLTALVAAAAVVVEVILKSMDSE